MINMSRKSYKQQVDLLEIDHLKEEYYFLMSFRLTSEVLRNMCRILSPFLKLLFVLKGEFFINKSS